MLNIEQGSLEFTKWEMWDDVGHGAQHFGFTKLEDSSRGGVLGGFDIILVGQRKRKISQNDKLTSLSTNHKQSSISCASN